MGVVFDACGKCGGDNSTCAGCDGVPKSGRIFDVCGDCLVPSDKAFITDIKNCPKVGCDGVSGSGTLLDVCGACLLPTAANFTTDITRCPNYVQPVVNNIEEGGSNGMPVGAVVGMVLAAVAIIGVAVYLYMRRQNVSVHTHDRRQTLGSAGEKSINFHCSH